MRAHREAEDLPGPTRDGSPRSRRRRAGAPAGGDRARVRGAAGAARTAGVLRVAPLCRRHHRPAAGQVLRGVSEKLTNRRVLAAAVLRAGAEPPRRRGVEAALADPDLARYRPWLTDIRLEKPYQLEDGWRAVPREVDTGYSAWNRLFDETIAALRFSVDGEDLGIEQTLHLLQEPEEARRRAAAEALAKTFGENIRVFSLITNVLAKDKEISDRWRGFPRHRGRAAPVQPGRREVVDALVEAARAAYPRLSHRYYALKGAMDGQGDARALGSQRTPPGCGQPDDPVAGGAPDGARRLCRLLAEDGRHRRRFFDERWIDAPVRPGKAPGAFAHPTVPSAHPFVLLNYLGRTRDVMTLAHELGHGVHQVLAARQGALMAPTPLTLAETASVFGEMLTFRALLAQTRSPEERRTLLASKVEDMINTVVRQIAFYTFERKVHSARREGELDGRPIGQLWMSVQAESLGPAIELKPGYETYWAYIPHFIHSPFYVYAYAFGDCLVNSLYAVFEKAEPGFQDKYCRAARGRRHQAPQGAAGTVRAGCDRSRLQEHGPRGDRADDRRTGRDGGLGPGRGTPDDAPRRFGDGRPRGRRRIALAPPRDKSRRRPICPDPSLQAGYPMTTTEDSERNRFTARAGRYGRVGTSLGGAAIRMAGQRLFGADDDAAAAAALTAALGNLKGPIMKVAQLLATIPEALPAEYAEELASLQSNAPRWARRS